MAKAVAEGELVRVARGVFRWAGDLAPREAHIARVRAIMSRQGSVVASHASAAVIHGLVIHGAVPELVHLTVAPPARVRKRSGYHVHVVPLTAEDVIEVDGVRVTSLARTAADLARTAEFAWAVAAADQALRRGVRVADLVAVADAAPGMKGNAALRAVGAFADGRSGSVAESISRVTIQRAGLPKPVLQFEVAGPEGWAGCSDFGWPDQGMVGEMDGEAKYRDRLEAKRQAPEKVFGAERVRDDAIRRANWWVVHWGWATAWDTRALGHKIREGFEDARRFRRDGGGRSTN